MPRLNKDTAKQRALKVSKGLRKHKGNQSALARELGVTPQAVNKKTRNPAFITLRQQAIQKAAERAGFTLDKIYQGLAEGLAANTQASFNGHVYQSDHPDHRARIAVQKIGLELFQHLGADTKDDAKPTEIHVHYGHRKQPRKPPEDE